MDLVHLLGDREEGGHRTERDAPVVHVEPGYDHPFAEIRQVPTYSGERLIEELRLVDSHHLGPRIEAGHDFIGSLH